MSEEIPPKVKDLLKILGKIQHRRWAQQRANEQDGPHVREEGKQEKEDARQADRD